MQSNLVMIEKLFSFTMDQVKELLKEENLSTGQIALISLSLGRMNATILQILVRALVALEEGGTVNEDVAG